MASLRGNGCSNSVWAWLLGAASAAAVSVGCAEPPVGTGTAHAPVVAGATGSAPIVPPPGSAGSAPTGSVAGQAAPPVVVPSTPQPTAAALPCEIGTLVSAKCGGCHGSTPIGGAPMPLVSQNDFSARIKSLKTAPGETLEVAALVKRRINDAAMPMPPGAQLPANELAALNRWLDQGHPQGAPSEVSCAKTTTPVTTQPVGKPSSGVKQANGSTCYQLRNHGQPQAGDTTPYSIVPGEHYVSFYYNAPWTEPSELVGWKTLYDNRKVMHHWLLYSTLGSTMDGTFAPSIGTHIGDAAQLIAGWAVGGNDVNMPKGVGLALPKPGEGLLLEWHFYNTEAALQMDSSSVEVCVVPAGSLEHTAGMTWLGTENFNGPLGMPPKTESQFSGTCFPSRTGMNATDPIHIFTLWPHMHTYGRHMRSEVTRADGKTEQVFDKPFDFNYQITYDVGIDLYPGDTITSTCTFNNTSNASVAFGPSTEQEMCYQFAFAYPIGALDNGVPSLVGATNTCW